MKKRVIVNDLMQKKYVYFLTEQEGKNFDPEFKPELMLKQMLELGVFSGKYLTGCKKEFPLSWFAQAKLLPLYPDSSLNFFKVHASQPLSVWQEKGWIYHEDPRGWFQWYCHYFMDRRCPDDQRQIKRWKVIKRHISQLKKHCKKGDFSCRPVQRQAVLHGAYDSRKK